MVEVVVDRQTDRQTERLTDGHTDLHIFGALSVLAKIRTFWQTHLIWTPDKIKLWSPIGGGGEGEYV